MPDTGNRYGVLRKWKIVAVPARLLFHVQRLKRLWQCHISIETLVYGEGTAGALITNGTSLCDRIFRFHDINYYFRFLHASALLTMQIAVLARPFLSVCLSVRPAVHHYVTFRYCAQTNEDTIVWFSASSRTILLVYEEVKFIWIFYAPGEGVKVKHHHR